MGGFFCRKILSSVAECGFYTYEYVSEGFGPLDHEKCDKELKFQCQQDVLTHVRWTCFWHTGQGSSSKSNILLATTSKAFYGNHTVV